MAVLLRPRLPLPVLLPPLLPTPTPLLLRLSSVLEVDVPPPSFPGGAPSEVLVGGFGDDDANEGEVGETDDGGGEDVARETGDIKRGGLDGGTILPPPSRTVAGGGAAGDGAAEGGAAEGGASPRDEVG
ncbi:hypothetical protein Vretimale_9608, partial [Volvox reticuliferus]